MAGHSKWSNIKNRKGKEDARRGQIFTKMSRMISVAVREGGTDPMYNAALQTAIDNAKAANMPNDNIERAIKRAAGEGSDTQFEEVWYEGYGPEGVAVIVQCLTDNRNRTAPDIRHAFDKYGGNLGQTGSVRFLFERKGILIAADDVMDEESFFLTAIDAGAEDVLHEEGYYEVTTEVDHFNQVKQALLAENVEFERLDLSYLPTNHVQITEAKNRENMEKMIDALEDNDDVQEVYHNWDMPEE